MLLYKKHNAKQKNITPLQTVQANKVAYPPPSANSLSN